MNQQPPQHIVIVGGGTAGWMAANLLTHRWSRHGTRVTLIESADIGTIGVGEGSTPFLRQFFRDLGIGESEWMPACNATYKCGIRFPGWSTVPGYEEYVHPFFNQQDYEIGSDFFDNADLRRQGFDVPANPADFFLSAELSRQCKAPAYLPHNGKPAPWWTDYAYHFDAGLLGAFLRGHAQKRGVTHKVGTISHVVLDERGDIAHLTMNGGETVKGDFFIDCSGFKSLLIQEALGERFVSYQDNLFNDRAIAIPTAIDETEDIPSETISAALSHGWAWRIPLQNRCGNGYVYASGFISDDQAEAELRRHLGPAAVDQEARRLKMRVGRMENHWRNNCLAVGLSQGFIEPLEATALMLIQLTVLNFIESCEQGGFSDRHRAQFNRRVNQTFDGVRNYVVGHYLLNTRSDTDYWCENRAHRHIPDSLASILEIWDKGGDFPAEIERQGEDLMYIRASWYCLLAGMGRFPEHLIPPAPGRAFLAQHHARAGLRKLASRFFGHRNYLATLRHAVAVAN